ALNPERHGRSTRTGTGKVSNTTTAAVQPYDGEQRVRLRHRDRDRHQVVDAVEPDGWIAVHGISNQSRPIIGCRLSERRPNLGGPQIDWRRSYVLRSNPHDQI